MFGRAIKDGESLLVFLSASEEASMAGYEILRGAQDDNEELQKDNGKPIRLSFPECTCFPGNKSRCCKLAHPFAGPFIFDANEKIDTFRDDRPGNK